MLKFMKRFFSNKEKNVRTVNRTRRFPSDDVCGACLVRDEPLHPSFNLCHDCYMNVKTRGGRYSE
jgi:hypothetical protein